MIYTIDLARCTGCQTCAVACKDRADLPDALDWLRVEAHEGGVYPQPTLFFRVVHCFHCVEAPCAAACPTGAIGRDDLGLVQIDGEACVRCGACGEVCPFGAIILSEQGPATKCDGCADELRQGWEPTCVRACPMRALGYVAEATPLPAQRAIDGDFQGHGIAPAVCYLRLARS
jgi:anaerobic dimethyl sulfoxide reductase subunit B (iron-sulfur subunit)